VQRANWMLMLSSVTAEHRLHCGLKAGGECAQRAAATPGQCPATLQSGPLEHKKETQAGEDCHSQKDHDRSASIGVQVKRVRGLITIIDLMPDGPAANLLKKGQILLQIDGIGRQPCANAPGLL
jgi:hypothetical protein